MFKSSMFCSASSFLSLQRAEAAVSYQLCTKVETQIG